MLEEEIWAKTSEFKAIGIFISAISKEREDGTVLLRLQRPSAARLESLSNYLNRQVDPQTYLAAAEDYLKKIFVNIEVAKTFQGPTFAA